MSDINVTITDSEAISVAVADDEISVVVAEDTINVVVADDEINVAVADDEINITIQEVDIIAGLFVMEKFTGDGSTVTFEFENAFRENSLFVFVNGFLREKDGDYTEAEDSRSITFVTAPSGASGNRNADKLEVRYVID